MIINDEKSMQQMTKREKEAERAKMDKNFVKDFRDSLPAKRALNKENGWALMIFEFLKTNMDNYNAIMCSSAVLEEYFDISRSTVSLAIKALIKHKFVDVIKSGTSSVYLINTEIAWASWANQKEYASFTAKVLVSKSEQKETKKVRKEVKKQTKGYRQLTKLKKENKIAKDIDILDEDSDGLDNV